MAKEENVADPINPTNDKKDDEAEDNNTSGSSTNNSGGSSGGGKKGSSGGGVSSGGVGKKAAEEDVDVEKERAAATKADNTNLAGKIISAIAPKGVAIGGAGGGKASPTSAPSDDLLTTRLLELLGRLLPKLEDQALGERIAKSEEKSVREKLDEARSELAKERQERSRNLSTEKSEANKTRAPSSQEQLSSSQSVSRGSVASAGPTVNIASIERASSIRETILVQSQGAQGGANISSLAQAQQSSLASQNPLTGAGLAAVQAPTTQAQVLQAVAGASTGFPTNAVVTTPVSPATQAVQVWQNNRAPYSEKFLTDTQESVFGLGRKPLVPDGAALSKDVMDRYRSAPPLQRQEIIKEFQGNYRDACDVLSTTDRALQELRVQLKAEGKSPKEIKAKMAEYRMVLADDRIEASSKAIPVLQLRQIDRQQKMEIQQEVLKAKAERLSKENGGTLALEHKAELDKDANKLNQTTVELAKTILKMDKEACKIAEEQMHKDKLLLKEIEKLKDPEHLKAMNILQEQIKRDGQLVSFVQTALHKDREYLAALESAKTGELDKHIAKTKDRVKETNIERHKETIERKAESSKAVADSQVQRAQHNVERTETSKQLSKEIERKKPEDRTIEEKLQISRSELAAAGAKYNLARESVKQYEVECKVQGIPEDPKRMEELNQVVQSSKKDMDTAKSSDVEVKLQKDYIIAPQEQGKQKEAVSEIKVSGQKPVLVPEIKVHAQANLQDGHKPDAAPHKEHIQPPRFDPKAMAAHMANSMAAHVGHSHSIEDNSIPTHAPHTPVAARHLAQEKKAERTPALPEHKY